MEQQKTYNHLKRCNVDGDYVGGNQINNYYTMFQDSEREFIVTHNVNIKPAAYFTGREAELQELRQRIENGRKAVLVSGMGGIGKTHICRKLFEEYLNKHAEDESGPFCHIGYIEYSGDMDTSLQRCLKFKQQDRSEPNREAAWRELEYWAADGKLLLFVDNVNKTIREDPGLQRLKGIPGAVVLTSRQASFSDEFESYRIGFLDMDQCKEIYEKIRFRCDDKKVDPEEIEDLKYVIENLSGRHTITVELLAHLAYTKTWAVNRLRKELEEKGFRLQFHKDGEPVNIQESYEKLYDLSELTEAEQNILEAFSVFPYIPLAAEICNEWLLADAGVTEDSDILMGLYQKGWLQLDIKQASYALHPVFAQFIYEKCKPNSKTHLKLLDLCRKHLKIPENSSSLECLKYIPFAESLVKKLHMTDMDFISELAFLLCYIGEYHKAEELYEKVLLMSISLLGEECPYTAVIYSNLAGTYEEQGNHRDAKRLYEKVLGIRKRILGENHPDTATIYNNLAFIYSKQGKYTEAKKLFEKALEIYRKTVSVKSLAFY